MSCLSKGTLPDLCKNRNTALPPDESTLAYRSGNINILERNADHVISIYDNDDNNDIKNYA